MLGLMAETNTIPLRLQLAARIWLHLPQQLSATEMRKLDQQARDRSHAPLAAQLAWWHARAERILHGEHANPLPDEAAAVLEEIHQQVHREGPVVAIGRAMFAAERLAASLGDTTVVNVMR